MNNDKIKKYNVQNLVGLGTTSPLEGVRLTLQYLITDQLVYEPLLRLQKQLSVTKNEYLKESIQYAITLKLIKKDEMIELNTLSGLIDEFPFDCLQELSERSQNIFVKEYTKQIVDDTYLKLLNNQELQEEFMKKKLMDE